MSFFRNFPIVDYKFGDETSLSAIQNLSAYIDVIDQVKDDVSFYEKYYIKDHTRPDSLSYELYGTIDYYWMFYLLNDKLRQQGWPLSESEIYSLSKEYYPNLVLLTDDTMIDKFYVGDYVATATGDGFPNPDFKAEILEKKYDLGQLVVKPLVEVRTIDITNGGSGYTSTPTVTITKGSGEGATAAASISNGAVTSVTVTNGGDGFTAAPTITISDPQTISGVTATATATISSNTLAIPSGGTATLYTKRNDKDVANWNLSDLERLLIWSKANQFDAIHHYEDTSGNYVDINIIPDAGKGVNNRAGSVASGSEVIPGTSSLVGITYTDRLKREVDDLREIKIFKPNVANQINSEFQRLIKQ